MKNNPIRKSYCCELKALTPVHVGSGKSLCHNFDFFEDKTQLRVINATRLFKQIEQLGENQIMQFTQAVEDNDVLKWLKANIINMDAITQYVTPFRDDRIPRDIRAHIRDGFGNPLIPGSSLKGAFRTAVLKQLCNSENNANIVADCLKKITNSNKWLNLKSADQPITRKLIGTEPKKNLFRTLTVRDFAFEKHQVGLQKIWVNRLINENTLRGKFPIFVEGLPEASKCQSMISLDQFLTEKEKSDHCFGFQTVLTLEWLLKACNGLSQTTVAHELKFLNGVKGKGVAQLQLFYNDLKKQIDALGKKETIINLAWGIGWCGMTGHLAEAQDLTPAIREKLNLAPGHLNFPFPKSRRLAEINNDVIPMGWVHLAFTSLAEFKQKQEKEIQKKQAESRLAEKKKNDQERWEKMSDEEKRLEAIRKDPLAVKYDRGKTVDPIQSIWPKINDDQTSDEHKKELAHAFKERWKLENKWNVKQKKYKQYLKVQTVKQILGEI